MDYANIDVGHINLLLEDFHPEGDTLNAVIKKLSAVERSGFTLRSFEGEFRVGPAFLKAHNLKVITDHCNLDLTFDFLYDSWNAYTDFLNKVRIVADIRPSDFDLQDIGAFAPVLYQMKNRFHISGQVAGTVSNFKASDFRVAFGENSRLRATIRSNGLPDILNTFVDMDIRELQTSHQDIAGLKLPVEGGSLPLPEFLKSAGLIRLKGIYTGFYNDFVTNLKASTDIGDITANIALKKIRDARGLSYSGELDAIRFDLGRLMNLRETMGRVTFRADLNGKGFNLDDADIVMNIRIDTMNLNRYAYHSIKLKGILSNKRFNGFLDVRDPNLNLDFNGIVDMGDSIPFFKFITDIHYAQLYNLNLLKRDPVNSVSSHIDVDIAARDIDHMHGRITVQNTRYTEGDRSIFMDALNLVTSRDEKGNKSYYLASDFVDADFSGEFSFLDMIPSLSAFINNYLASFNLADTLIRYESAFNQLFNFQVYLKNTDQVTAVFLPFLNIAPDTYLEGYYNEGKGLIGLNGTSPEITLLGMHLFDWHVTATTRKDNLNLETGCSRFFLKKGKKNDTVEVYVDTVSLVTDLRHDSILYDLTFVNRSLPSEISGSVDFGEDPAILIKFDRFHIFIDNKYWSLDPGNSVMIDSSSVGLENIDFHSGGHGLMARGKISEVPSDTLYVLFDSLDVSNLDKLLGDTTIDLDGILGGKLTLSNLYSKMNLNTDLRIDRFRFNHELLGDAMLKVNYDQSLQRFEILSEIVYTGNIGTNIPFSLSGNLSVAEENPVLDMNLNLKNLNLKMVAPFVSGFMSGLRGLASGDVAIGGTLKKPVVRGQLKLMRTEFRINYLNVPYSLSDVVNIDTNAILFNNITLFDSLGHKASLNGRITHQYFSNLALDMNIDFTDFSAFRNTYAQNNLFYGNARATGNVRIQGTTDNIGINVRAATGGGTHVVIPINMTADISQNDYIIFEDPLKDTLNTEVKIPKQSAGGPSLNLSLQVNPSADLEVFFPDQLGNIRASGTGSLVMNMTPVTAFSLTGTYVLQKGTFLFALKNLLRLNFSIREGSRIAWSGDPTDASLSLAAVYKTRVPLAGLVSDPEKAAVRIPVECVIRLNGKLMNPDIAFTLNMPNVEEDIKSLVYSVLDTSNTSEMNQQMIYLLVMNQFKPVTGSGFDQIDVSGTSLSLLTNQVSSWLSSISRNVNVGVNYKPGSQTTGQEFDVSLSTQLFNDRLLIDGVFGMSSGTNYSASKASTVVGDINIEYILTKNRRYRLRAFNRTNSVDILNNNSQYTQGVGIGFQRDFTNWGDLFKSEKKAREKKTGKKQDSSE